MAIKNDKYGGMDPIKVVRKTVMDCLLSFVLCLLVLLFLFLFEESRRSLLKSPNLSFLLYLYHKQ